MSPTTFDYLSGLRGSGGSACATLALSSNEPRLLGMRVFMSAP